eukprot:496824-Rhodomonas_salina.2
MRFRLRPAFLPVGCEIVVSIRYKSPLVFSFEAEASRVRSQLPQGRTQRTQDLWCGVWEGCSVRSV